MKTKKILRFYFSAESLDRAFDNLIINKACLPFSDGLDTAEMLCSVIGDKIQLERLWGYLDGVISGFSEGERETLLKYSGRCAVLNSGDKAVKRAVVKFMRRAHRLEDFAEEISVLKKYYCLLRGN